MLTLASLPWTAALRAPAAPALHTDRGTLDFRSLDRAAAGVARALNRRGIAAQDRIAVCCGNSPAFAALYYGALRCNAVVVLLHPAAPVAELARAIRRLRVRLVAADSDNAGKAAAATRTAATGTTVLIVDDATPTTSRRNHISFDALVDHPSTAPLPTSPATPAVIINTSGTTGTPRAALHSHTGLLLNARAVAGEMLHLDEHDVQLGALPLPHSFGMSAVLNASVLAGSAVVLMQRFDPHAALELITQKRVTVLQAVPTMFARLTVSAINGNNGTPASLRLAVVSGAPLPAGLATQVHQHLCSSVVERYGMTEVSPLTMRQVPADGGAPGDVGRPMWGVGVRVVGGATTGELEVTAPSMFIGYAGSRQATADALIGGFFRTGDLGHVDGSGRVMLTGRLKDLVIRGGYNVAAREVEQLLEAHPAVMEVAVVGLPDDDLGEEVAAALVLRPGRPGHAGSRHQTAGAVAAELRARCIASLAGYKRPRRWFVLEQLPRTASGKVLKGELRDLLLHREPALVES